jgi:internalin A
MTQDELLQIIEQAAADGATELDLSGSDLTELPPEIGQLTQLEVLVLGKEENGEYIGNKLTCLPPEIGLLKQLKVLQVSGNYRQKYPNAYPSAKPGNQLSQVPAEIGQLTNLQQLDLRSNQLSQVPAEIGQLTSLQQLDLSSNQLSQVPAEIVQLTNLQQLDLRSNQLSQVPAEIVQLTTLQQLDLSSNQLSQVPAEIVQLTNLQQLSLSSNQLSQVPAEIVQLTTLQQLSLSSNQLSQVPAEIGQLTTLQQLSLSSNQLSQLPAEIGQLTTLQQLSLSSNQLSQLPAEIGQLTKLTQLDLYCNKFSDLPVVLKQLPLRSIDLSGNPLPIPPEIIGTPNRFQDATKLEAIFDFYESTDENSLPLYEAKFLIVGEGGAGKTSLAKKIQNPDYKLDPDEDSTHGIDVIQWRFPLNDEQEFRVNLWDFGGQEIYTKPTSSFSPSAPSMPWLPTPAKKILTSPTGSTPLSYLAAIARCWSSKTKKATAPVMLMSGSSAVSFPISSVFCPRTCRMVGAWKTSKQQFANTSPNSTLLAPPCPNPGCASAMR